MSIWDKICEVLMAPFTGVYEKLDEWIDNTAIKLTLYFIWCFSLGWFFTLGTALTCAMIGTKFSKESD